MSLPCRPSPVPPLSGHRMREDYDDDFSEDATRDAEQQQKRAHSPRSMNRFPSTELPNASRENVSPSGRGTNSSTNIVGPRRNAPVAPPTDDINDASLRASRTRQPSRTVDEEHHSAPGKQASVASKGSIETPREALSHSAAFSFDLLAAQQHVKQRELDLLQQVEALEFLTAQQQLHYTQKLSALSEREMNVAKREAMVASKEGTPSGAMMNTQQGKVAAAEGSDFSFSQRLQWVQHASHAN